MTMRFTVPAEDWDATPAEQLARAVRHTPTWEDVVIQVPDTAMKELGERAAARLGRTNLTFETAEPTT